MNRNDSEQFAMLFQHDMQAAIALVKQRKLELRDMAVLNALVAEMDTATGRIRVTATHLAAQLGITVPVCVSSLTRLRREMMLARIEDKRSGSAFYVVNPFLIAVGGARRRNYLWKLFKEAKGDDAE